MNERELRTALSAILVRADSQRADSATFTAREVDGWPADLREALTQTRVLRRSQPQQATACPQCDEDHIVEIEWDGERALGWCPTSGRVSIDPSLLRAFTLSSTHLAEVLQSHLGIREPVHELAPGRLWRLGALGPPPRTVFLARGFTWDDTQRIFSHPGLRRVDGAILLTLSESYSDERTLHLVPLTRVLMVIGQRLGVDLDTAAIAVAERPAALAGATFRRDGSGWVVAYNDEGSALSSRLGYEYIRLLLAHPFRDFQPEQLEQKEAPDNTFRIGAVDADALSVESGHRDPLIDSAGRSTLKRHAAALRAEGRADEAAGVENYIQQGTRPGGRAKHFENQDTRVARNVKRAINRALATLAESAPRLARHLDASITLSRGEPIAYRPEQPIRWQTD